MVKASRFILFFGLMAIVSHIYAKPLVIQGYTHTKDKDSLYLYTYQNTGDYLEGMSPVSSVKPDSNGFFRFIYQMKEGKEFTLKQGDKYIFFNVFFSAGDSIRINMSDNAIGYEGNGQNNVAYNDSFPQVFYRGDEGKKYTGSFKMSLDSFNSYIDERKEARYHFLQKFADEKPLSDAFINQANQDIEYNWALDKLQYLWKYTYFHHMKGVVEAKPGYFDFIDKLDIQHKLAFNVRRYYFCVKDYATEIWEQKLHRNPYKDQYKFENQIRARLSVIDSLYRGKIRVIAYGQVFEDILKWPGTKDNQAKIQFTDSLLEIFKKDHDAKQIDFYEYFLKEKNQNFSLMNQPAPDFKLKDLNDSIVSLTNYRGKVILLDFWSVHCAPCIKEIPNSNTLQDKLKGKDFVVVTVCFDSKQKEWKGMIVKQQWKGIHLFNNFDAHLNDKYFFNSYPHYVLIDKFGIIRESNAYFDIQNLEGHIEDLLKN